MGMRSCVHPEGRFVVGVHRPAFEVTNLRENDYVGPLGELPDRSPVMNTRNFPEGDLAESGADPIYEIANPLPFRGTTYINSRWADRNAQKPDAIRLPGPGPVSMSEFFRSLSADSGSAPAREEWFRNLPRPILIALANTSTDPEDLEIIARIACRFDEPAGGTTPAVRFRQQEDGSAVPDIRDHILFEIVVNNPCLPDALKQAMVLRPGIQGTSEITGEWLAKGDNSHVFEYLRRNSYIPWGHFAANTADDTVRYRIRDLSLTDMRGMRHLYYQRTMLRIAQELGICGQVEQRTLSEAELERLRLDVLGALRQEGGRSLRFNGVLWGWNFGFGYAQSGFRLHASHQQIHQQYALIPKTIEALDGSSIPSYACGDLVADWVRQYRKETGADFFERYLAAIRGNTRTDGRSDRPSSLVVFEDANVMLFVPKAQTSQWELQLMPKTGCGNCVEADPDMRFSLDRGILTALGTLESMGARMVTSIEFSKRIDVRDNTQKILYSFLPKMPDSPGAFSEAQLRWINGHYPEDFALACRRHLPAAL